MWAGGEYKGDQLDRLRNAKKAATPLIEEAIRNDPAMYPQPKNLKNSCAFPEEVRLREFAREVRRVMYRPSSPTRPDHGKTR